mmetsp:Transcript_25387/g.58501  ORF Transcript_25387/g.58501 Transcript_25387/m.58501 type:complete len:385 (+) Transcript_25387:357-1511(+)
MSSWRCISVHMAALVCTTAERASAACARLRGSVASISDSRATSRSMRAMLSPSSRLKALSSALPDTVMASALASASATSPASSMLESSGPRLPRESSDAPDVRFLRQTSASASASALAAAAAWALVILPERVRGPGLADTAVAAAATAAAVAAAAAAAVEALLPHASLAGLLPPVSEPGGSKQGRFLVLTSSAASLSLSSSMYLSLPSASAAWGLGELRLCRSMPRVSLRDGVSPDTADDTVAAAPNPTWQVALSKHDDDTSRSCEGRPGREDCSSFSATGEGGSDGISSTDEVTDTASSSQVESPLLDDPGAFFVVGIDALRPKGIWSESRPLLRWLGCLFSCPNVSVSASRPIDLRGDAANEELVADAAPAPPFLSCFTLSA